jgi:translocation and assembly module TamA
LQAQYNLKPSPRLAHQGLGFVLTCVIRNLIYLLLLLAGLSAQAAEHRFEVDIDAPAPVNELLEKHLQLIKWQDNPRMTPGEWRRLYAAASQNIKDLLVTEGYFAPKIIASLESKKSLHTAKFKVEPGAAVIIKRVDLNFSGAITSQAAGDSPSMQKLRDSWMLPTGAAFRQEDWAQAKRRLLASLLIERYPNASISKSQASIDLESQSVVLTVDIDSGEVIYLGAIQIEGLKRYPASMVENLNPIKIGSLHSQAKLLAFQTSLQNSGYFSNVEVTADTMLASKNNETGIRTAPVRVTVVENQTIILGVGVGYSTNTGARTQLTLDEPNFLDRGWRMSSSLRIEEKAQSLTGQVRLPVTRQGYRDSINAGLNRIAIEGQTLTSAQSGVKRAWGPRQREQYMGANYLVEHEQIDGGASSNNKAATLTYGITLRRTDNELAPTRGYMLNVQFAGAPLDSLSDGRFLQSYLKTQAYYPITASTQFIARLEAGMVNGKNSAPAAFLFRAGGDQSVRGYGFQSLGVREGDAVIGGRYLLTGSVEAIQWLTEKWGAAAFFDFGNAADRAQDLKPVYGYGLGGRWKSPIGPVGADIAYGQETGAYRLHLNLGIVF